ncbi:MAG: chromosome partitioning protein ParB [Pusillimonas sp.]|nr:chromosome partitioning protein ParB [Pusillimonas sp.]|tara:strand:- start:126723 stop:128624 length:1902 start_codon:yes stop_codon:yes gene_type:complete
MTTHLEISIDKLTLSTRFQARKTPGNMPLTELADSIDAQGLLQNLVVTKAKKRGTYEVIAGGRRLQAMQILIKAERMKPDAKVWAKLVDNAHAYEASLTENVQREAMHPADEFEAFARLIDEGSSAEAIAARFGVTPAAVRRRLRLASVAPDLIDIYRKGDMTLDALMAFTVTEDQDAQRAVWASLENYYTKDAGEIRRRLTQEAVTAGHAMARYVGLEAYHEAGGRSFTDLFATEDERGIYLQDVTLLEQLTNNKLALVATEIEKEGWAWVQVQPTFDSAWYSFGRVRPEMGTLSNEQQTQIEEIDSRLQATEEEMDAIDDEDGDHEKWTRLEQEQIELQDRREAIEIENEVWSASAKAIAGVGIFLDSEGQVQYRRGLIRPEDRRVAQEAGKNGEGEAHIGSLPVAKTRPMHSERLVRQLSANKVGIVGVELAARPDIALAVLVAQLARNTFGGGYFSVGDFGLGVRLKTEDIDLHAPDFAQSKAGVEMEKYRQHWFDVMPLDENGNVNEDVLPWALEQDTGTLLELLSFILATSVQGVQHIESNNATTLDVLANIAGVDASKWWEPTAESYLSHVSKDRISVTVEEAVGSEAAASLTKLKKKEAVVSAEQLLAGKGWLPKLLQVTTESPE